MFNKYLLISTLVCGLMSVSMGYQEEIEGYQKEIEQFESTLEDIQIYAYKNPGSESKILEHLKKNWQPR